MSSDHSTLPTTASLAASIKTRMALAFGTTRDRCTHNECKSESKQFDKGCLFVQARTLERFAAYLGSKDFDGIDDRHNKALVSFVDRAPEDHPSLQTVSRVFDAQDEASRNEDPSLFDHFNEKYSQAVTDLYQQVRSFGTQQESAAIRDYLDTLMTGDALHSVASQLEDLGIPVHMRLDEGAGGASP